MTPYKCPVCEGKKEDYLNCGPCSGTGIIWDTSFKITYQPNPQPTIDPYFPYPGYPNTWICGDDLSNPTTWQHADNISTDPNGIQYTVWN